MTFLPGLLSQSQRQNSGPYKLKFRQLDDLTTNLNQPNPDSSIGIAYNPRSQTFLITRQSPSQSGETDIFTFESTDQSLRSSPRQLGADLSLQNIAFDRRFNRLVGLVPDNSQLVLAATDDQGELIPALTETVNIQPLGLQEVRDVSVANNGDIYILEGGSRGQKTSKIRRIRPQGDGRIEDITASTEVQLPKEIKDPIGLAIEPTTNQLYTVDRTSATLYELTPEGELNQSLDLSEVGITEPSSLAFAPSTDSTDAESEQSLFVTSSSDTSGGIYELSSARTVSAESTFVPTVTPTLIQTIQASQFSPPSPDTSGIVYREASNSLIIVDSEVSEIPILFSGVNTWELDLDGNPILNTGATVDFSGEPTGLSINPANGHFFISDDVARDVFEVDPGADGLIGGGDDTVTAFDTVAVGNDDPEGVAFATINGQSSLFVVDGFDSEVYQYSLNGQLLNQFDIESSGIVDPEGIVYDPVRDRLFIVGDNPVVGEFTTSGTLTGYFDISAAQARKAAGLTLGPSSIDSAQTSLYIVDRGVDNNIDPDENDGKIYEFLLPAANSADLALTQTVSNATPQVGDNVTFTLTLTNESGQDANGVQVTNDLPAELSFVSATPSQGNFNSGNGIWTVGTLAAGASITLAISANVSVALGELVFNTAEVTASENPDPDSTPGNGLAGEDDQASTSVGPEVFSRTFAITASSDDAEEGLTGKVSRTSSDLELITDGGAQTVGLRFTGVDIPKDITLTNAYIQFQTDEVSLGEANLIIHGENSDNPLTFSNTNKISTRQTTSALQNWNPEPWTTSGEAGVKQQTPNLSNIIQEIIDRPGWESGNAIATIFTGSGVRVAESFDGTAVPQLILEYIDNRQPGADIELTQLISETAVNIGDVVAFDLTISNKGPDTTDNIVVEDLLPSGFNFDSANASQGSYNSSTGLWSVGSLGNNNNATLTLFGTAASTGSYTNTAEVISSSVEDPDSSPGNGNASEDDQDSVEISVFSPAQNILDIAITASSDDAEENSRGKVSQTSSDLELVTDRGNVQTVGLRFVNVALPEDATITRAYIQFQTDEVSTDAANLTIRGDDQDNALTYSNANKISSRPTTTNSALWTPDPWTVIGEAGANQQTADLSAIVQEIIDRPGWVTRNALSLIITGSGSRIAESFNGTAPPLLHLEYSTPQGIAAQETTSFENDEIIGNALTRDSLDSDPLLLGGDVISSDEPFTTAAPTNFLITSSVGDSDPLSTSTTIDSPPLVETSSLERLPLMTETLLIG